MKTIPEQPHMRPKEAELLEQWLPTGGKVLEFGAGSSTKFFFAKGAGLVASVESDVTFLEVLAADPVVGFFHKKERWLPLHADIGETGFLGYPLEQDKGELAFNYYHGIWDGLRAFFHPAGGEAPAADNKIRPDLVLIDGRFRVACFCATLLHCGLERLPIFIHDFWNRPQYHCVLDFAEVRGRSDTAVLLLPKERIRWPLLKSIFEEHMFVPD